MRRQNGYSAKLTRHYDILCCTEDVVTKIISEMVRWFRWRRGTLDEAVLAKALEMLGMSSCKLDCFRRAPRDVLNMELVNSNLRSRALFEYKNLCFNNRHFLGNTIY